MNLLKSEKNKHDFVLENEIEQMKMLCLSNFNNQYELFKLLVKDSFIELIVKIPKKSYSMYVSLDNTKPTLIDEETFFLRNLDNYVSFIKDNFDISPNSVIDIVEATIVNYNNSDMLYCLDEEDLHNSEKYYKSYFRMFYYAIFDNLYYFSKRRFKNYYIKEFYKEINNYNIEDKNNIKKVLKLLKVFFDNKYENVIYLFLNHNNTNEIEQSSKIEEMFKSYYSNKIISSFTINKDDNYIVVDNKSKLLFNICSNIDSLGNEDEVLVEFGISNDYFNLKVKEYLFRKKELLKFYSKLNNIKTKDRRYNEELCFVNPTLRFEFWGDDDLSLDIQFFCNGGLDSYTLYLGMADIINLYELLTRQIF